MHWTTHVLTGAAIGYLVGRPVPAAVIGFADHMLLDTIPHADPDSDAGYIIDSLGGAAIIGLIATGKGVQYADPRRSALAGALGAGLPDLEILRKLFTTVFEEDYWYPSHRGIIPHRSTDNATSLVIQGILIGVTVGLAFVKWLRFRRAGGTAARGG